MRRLALVLAAVVPLTLSGACGDDSTSPEATIFGSYTLQTVNGNTLPWRFLVVGNDWAEITGGNGNINRDGTYSLTGNFRVMQRGRRPRSLRRPPALTSETGTRSHSQTRAMD